MPFSNMACNCPKHWQSGDRRWRLQPSVRPDQTRPRPANMERQDLGPNRLHIQSDGKPACQTGDCDGRLACNGTIGLPPATLVQISLQPDKSKPTFYDVSLVDGYNLPVLVTTKPKTPECSIGGCSTNMNSLCPQELQVLNNKKEVVACKSACLAFDMDVFCCRNDYGTPEKCKPSVYSKMFKDACPSYFSYAFDTPPPLVNCASKEYVITFCPSKWGDERAPM